jgi:hypothetical protein
MTRKHCYSSKDGRDADNIFAGRPERKRALGIPRRRWEDSTGMDLRGTVWEGVDWMHLAEDGDQRWTLVNTVMNFRVP